jgi:hypothetical protein
VIDEEMSNGKVYFPMPHNELENVHELREGVSFLHEDFLCPMNQHGIPVFHSEGKGWSYDLQSLFDNRLGLEDRGFEKTMKYLKYDSLMNCKLGDDVREEEMSIVLCARVDAGLGEETRPGKGHETPELAPLLLIRGIVNVGRGDFNEKAGQLTEQDPNMICLGVWIIRIYHLNQRKTSLLNTTRNFILTTQRLVITNYNHTYPCQ